MGRSEEFVTGHGGDMTDPSSWKPGHIVQDSVGTRHVVVRVEDNRVQIAAEKERDLPWNKRMTDRFVRRYKSDGRARWDKTDEPFRRLDEPRRPID